MKTKHLRKLYKDLSALNDRYSHYLFVWEQFYLNYSNMFKENSEKLTTEIFLNNNNSRQFNVKLGYLLNSHDDTQHFILNSLFVLSYSFFEKYLIELHKFAKSFDSSILELNQNLPQKNSSYTSMEDKITIQRFLNRLSININKSFTIEEILTLDYIRLRRNKIVHDSLSVQGKILEIISHNGKKLNIYWDKNLKSGRYKIDFSIKDIAFFEKLELFDLLNIIRKISSKIDELIINRIGETLLLKNILKDFIKTHSNDIKGLRLERIQKKFLGFCRTEYSYEIDVSKLEVKDFKVV